MAQKFSPPALQHLARAIHDTPAEVAKALIDAYLSHPPFSYKLMGQLVQKAMQGKFSREQFDDAVRKHQKNEKYQKAFLELTPLIHSHFSGLRPKFILPVEPRKYLLNNLEIPFRPPFAFELDGKIIIPWFIFWKDNPLTEKQLSLMATLIRELLAQDPDFRDAVVLIYDFSAPNGDVRRLQIRDLASIPLMTKQERDLILGVFLDGYALALSKLEDVIAARKISENRTTDHRPGLFDTPEE